MDKRQAILNGLTVVQLKAIKDRIDNVPIAFTKQSTIDSLIRKGVFERYTVRQYWNGTNLVYDKVNDSAAYTHTGTRLTGLGFHFADKLGYMGSYEAYANELGD